MAHHFFAFLSRMRHINRWGLMRNTFQENIQEHSHAVAVIAHALAVIARDIYGKEVDPNLTATAALFHDAPEILTGDLPTPVKYHNPEIQLAYKELEALSADKLLAMLPEVLRPTYRPLLHENCGSLEQSLVKAADKISAYVKCVEELKAGNSEFKQAEAQIRKTLAQHPLPEVAYFMEHFMPSFSLTLDELQ